METLTGITIGFLAIAPLVDEPDKMSHYVFGAATSAIVTEYTKDPIKGCLAGLALGVAKEAYDSRHGGHVELKDALATGAFGCTFNLTW